MNKIFILLEVFVFAFILSITSFLFNWDTDNFDDDLMKSQEYNEGLSTPLYFSSEGGSYKVSLTGDVSLDLVCSSDNSIWDTFVMSQEYTIEDGNSLYIKLRNGASPVYPSSTDKADKFVTTGDTNAKLYCSGNLMSLVSNDFANEKSITQKGAFRGLFYKTNIEKCPLLPAIEITESCYSVLFADCVKLKSCPELPAKSVKKNSYESMFSGCAELLEAPELPATSLGEFCYSRMFQDCGKLSKVPDLNCKTLASHCYFCMFLNCHQLTTAMDVLPAETPSDYCYMGMFNECNLTKTPEICLKTLGVDSCKAMFDLNKNLNYAYVHFEDWLDKNGNFATIQWMRAAAKNGTFVCSDNLPVKTGTGAIPKDWNIVNFYDVDICNSEHSEIVAKVDGQEEEKAFAEDEVELSYSSEEGYVFNRWNVVDSEGNEVEVEGNKFIMPSSDVTVSANEFSPELYSIDMWQNDHVESFEMPLQAHESQVVNLPKVCTESDNYKFDHWYVIDENGDEVEVLSENNSDYYFIMPALTVIVAAAVDHYDINIIETDGIKVDAPENGSPSGDIVDCNFALEPGYSLDGDIVICNKYGEYKTDIMVDISEDEKSFSFVMPMFDVEVELKVKFVDQPEPVINNEEATNYNTVLSTGDYLFDVVFLLVLINVILTFILYSQKRKTK